MMLWIGGKTISYRWQNIFLTKNNNMKSTLIFAKKVRKEYLFILTLVETAEIVTKIKSKGHILKQLLQFISKLCGAQESKFCQKDSLGGKFTNRVSGPYSCLVFFWSLFLPGLFQERFMKCFSSKFDTIHKILKGCIAQCRSRHTFLLAHRNSEEH